MKKIKLSLFLFFIFTCSFGQPTFNSAPFLQEVGDVNYKLNPYIKFNTDTPKTKFITNQFIRTYVTKKSTDTTITIICCDTTDFMNMYDTVKVIMLICDTSLNPVWADTIFYMPDYKVHWTFGYEVYKYTSLHWGTQDVLVGGGWESILYLDENKKRFRNSTIVWMTKKL